jgi:outer membrane protein
MKKSIFIILFLIGISNSWAQKVAYVDSQFILENIPEYLQAKKELDNTSYDWQEEIESKYQEIDVLYRAYQTDKVLLTEKMRQAREDEIIEKEKDVKNLQQKRFGAEGDLYKKQEELIRPIQNQIYNAIQEFAENGKYGIIFDKSSELLMLYSSKNLDKSDKILDLLGY